MESDHSGKGKVVIVCFMIMWVGTALSMGLFLFPQPFFLPFGFVPFIMAAVGIVFCFAALRANSNTTRTRRRVGSGYSISTTGDAMYRDRESRSPSYQRPSKRIVYQIPSRCPSCGAALNSEQVDWVGPLQAQCPYCLTTIEASERDF